MINHQRTLNEGIDDIYKSLTFFDIQKLDWHTFNLLSSDLPWYSRLSINLRDCSCNHQRMVIIIVISEKGARFTCQKMCGLWRWMAGLFSRLEVADHSQNYKKLAENFPYNVKECGQYEIIRIKQRLCSLSMQMTWNK